VRKALVAFLLFVALAVLRLVVQGTVSSTVTTEECHTGGMAQEILAHGFALPFGAYTPEVYENGIVLQGFAAAAFFASIGPSVLTLRVLALLVSWIGLLLTWSLAKRTGNTLGMDAERAQWSLLAVCLLMTGLAPGLLGWHSTYALGGHNEGKVLTLALLWLFALRIESPTAARRASLWLCLGLFAFAHKGTLMVAAIAGIHELVAVTRRNTRPRQLLIEAAAFGIGAIPLVLRSSGSQMRDWQFVASKFQMPLSQIPRHAWNLLCMTYDNNLLLLAIVALTLGWVLRAGWQRRAALPIALVSYVLLNWLVAAPTRSPSYRLYSYPVAIALVSVALTHALGWVAQRGKLPAWSQPLLAALVTLVILMPRSEWRPRTIAELANNHEMAVCTWRFGRGFLSHWNFDDSVALQKCRTLEGDAALGCIAGLSRELAQMNQPRLPPDSLNAKEVSAWAFGLGLTGGHPLGTRCSFLPDTAERATCEGAFRLDCLAGLDPPLRILHQTALPRPRCDLRNPPYGGFYRGLREDLLQRTTAADRPEVRSVFATLGIGDDYPCIESLRACGYLPTAASRAPSS